MTEHVKQRHLFAADRTLRAWSVSFDPDSVSPDGTREDLARNMVAEVALGSAKVRNDFDNVPIFNRPIFNATWDSATGRWVDFVAREEEGFTFAPTDPNREVVYRCKPFWYKVEFKNGCGPTFVSVSDRQLEGYRLAPMFKNGATCEYRPCFEMAIGSDGKPHSRAGLYPLETTPTTIMEKAFSYDVNARTETTADWFSDYLLLLVEFATRNLQGIMPGRAHERLPLEVVTTHGTGYPRGFYMPEVDQYREGDMFVLTFLRGETYSYTYARYCGVIEKNDNGYLVDLGQDDMEAVLMEWDQVELYYPPQQTGTVLPFVTNASSGMRDGANGGCVWRGKEHPWGNFSSLLCDVIFYMQRPAGLLPYVISDIKLFDGERNEHYTQCSCAAKLNFTGGVSFAQGFAPAALEHILVPSAYQSTHPEYYFASRVRKAPATNAGNRFLRVGGDFRDPVGTNHATFELYCDEWLSQFGARLVLEEVY